jgi:hypothetical protein
MLLSLVAKGSRPGASIHTFITNWVICYNFVVPIYSLAGQNPISPTHQIHTGIHCPHSTSAVSEAADFHTISYSADHEPYCTARPLLALFLHLTFCLPTRPLVSLCLIPCSLPATTCFPPHFHTFPSRLLFLRPLSHPPSTPSTSSNPN